MLTCGKAKLQAGKPDKSGGAAAADGHAGGLKELKPSYTSS
jgi:hypothetical protein